MKKKKKIGFELMREWLVIGMFIEIAHQMHIIICCFKRI